MEILKRACRQYKGDRRLKPGNYICGSIFWLIILLLFNLSCAKGKATSPTKKVMVLGFDGMDPRILEDLLAQGKLPNFQLLKGGGDYRPLATSIPPQSPVAWSNFITGMDSGGHGIFDFIHRDPQTMIPYLSTSRTESAKRTIHIGDWVLPLSGGEVELLRNGKSFWEILEEHGIDTTIFMVPANFPPVETDGYSLSGMGTPDIQGTYGIFSYFTNSPISDKEDVSGGKIYKVEVVNNRVVANLAGPRNYFRKNSPQAAVEFQVWMDPENKVAKISIQDRDILLNEGEWSEWVQVEFPLIPLLQSVSGICRFYLKEVHPYFKLYVTPVNIDPSAPALPISTPKDYSEELCEKVGFFYTQGIPEDTKALSEDVLDDKAFLEQAGIVLQERLKLFEYELSRFQQGLLFFYFGSSDQVAHMFWRTMDKTHPAYTSSTKYASVIEDIYREMDQILGRAMGKVDSETTLIVMSDHGFGPFYRSFNLNTWLKKEGYISVIDESIQDEKEFFQNVDWSRTQAYGLGLNGLYLNLASREINGIVMPGAEKEKLINDLVQKLLKIKDPKTNAQVIQRVYRPEEIYSGPYIKDAPDLLIGYNWGYRASWETTIGKLTKKIFADNKNKWSGDHCIAADLVPGIVLTNKKIRVNEPSLLDLAPTILAEFGIDKESTMIGKSIF